jgi:hypothetical protein
MGEGTATGSDPACQQAAHHNFAEARIIGCGPAEDRGGAESAMGQGQGTTSEKGRVKGKIHNKAQDLSEVGFAAKRQTHNHTIFNPMKAGPLAEIRPIWPWPCTAESGPAP